MELKIYNQSGVLKLTAEASSSSTWNQELMVEDCVSATFVHPFYVPLDVNDYVMLDGVKFSIKKEYKPKQKNRQTYSYSVKFYGPIHDSEQVKYLNLTDGQYEPQFSLDGSPREHLQKWVDNVNRIYGEERWQIGDVIDAPNQTIEYNNTSCWDAGAKFAEAFGTELWADGFYINLCRCERGERVPLGYLQGLVSLTQSENNDDVKFFTRLIPLGSTRNIDRNRYGFSRLQLPGREKYIDRNTQYGLYEHVEADAFAGIFPHYTGTVTSVRTEEKTGEDGKKFTVYYFQDSGMQFDPCQNEIAGLVKRVSFQTGDLAGHGNSEGNSYWFEANYHPQAGEWEIINIYPNEDMQLPGGNLVPAVGDTYIPWNFRMPVEYEVQAEKDYQAAVNDFLEKYSEDISKYGGDTDYTYIDRNAVPLQLGQSVRLLSDEYFPETGYRDSRMTKVVRKLDNLSMATIECTNRMGKGWKKSVDDHLANLQYVVGEKLDRVVIDVLKTWDNKEPSNYNVFSALRVLKEITDRAISKIKPDETEYPVKFLGGLIADNIQSQDFSSGPLGSGYILKRNAQTGKSYIEADEIYIRLKAYFDTLEIKHLSQVGGRLVLSPAGMECIKVEEVAAHNEALYDGSGERLFDSEHEELLVPVFDGETAYRCYFKQSDGGKEIINEFAVGDLAQCREFNVKTGISAEVGNQYYWRRVIGIGSDYIDLSKTVCDTGSMAPLAGDTIVTVGNDTDKTRQHVVFLSSYDDDAPCIKLYSGINNFSMEGKEVTVISPNADKNIFTGQMIIKPGSTGFENLADAPDISAIHEDIKKAQNAATGAKESAGKASDAVSKLNQYVDGAFADGIITEAEAKNLEKYINIVNSEKASAESGYNILASNPYLEGTARVSLMNAKTNLMNTVSALVNSINTAIADGKTTVAEKQDVDAKYKLFNQYVGSFYEAVEAANTSIQNKLKSYSDNAQKAADEANNNASSAMDTANKANSAVSDLNQYVDGAFADGIISEAEAKSIEKYINTVATAKKEVEATYNALYENEYLAGLAKTALQTTQSSFLTSVSELIAAIQAAIADNRTTATEKNNVDSKYAKFSTAYASMRTAIENANKSIQDRIRALAGNDATQEAVSQIEKVTQKTKEDMAKQMGYADYAAMQEAARKGQTLISGGEINTTLINADAIVTSALIASAVRTNELNVNGKFRVKTDGTVAMQGELRSKSDESECIISSGFIRLMDGSMEAARLAINQGTPELTIIDGTNLIRLSPWGLVFTMNWTDQLIFDARQIGKGTIKKKSDGTLYVTEDSTSQIHYFMNTSEGGTTSPAPGRYIVDQGTTMYITALPDEGYEFVRWSDGGTQSHKVTIQTGGQSYTAYFAKKQVTQYTVSLNAVPANGGTVSGGGIYEAGTVNTVSAVAADGYRFVRWSDGGYAAHKVTWDGNKELTAYFEMYNVTGDEIFLGANLQGKTYTETYKVGTLGYFSVDVSNARMSVILAGPSGSESGFWPENPGWIFFNKGYLGSKLSKGHKYRLTLTAKTVSDTARAYIIAAIGTYDISTGSLGDITNGNGLIYAEEVLGTARAFTLDFTAERDSTVSDALCMCFIPQGISAAIYVTDISLKEI